MGDLVVPTETEGGLLDQMTQLDRRMNEIQAELQQQELRFKHLHDERSLLEQLHTINQMTSRKMNDEAFGDSKGVQAKRLFLEMLPDPGQFAKFAEEQALRGVEEGMPEAEELLHDAQNKHPLQLLHDELETVLKTTVKDPVIELRMADDEVFLHCAVVTCGSADEAERSLRTLTGRWRLPPNLDRPVQLHYIDESVEPRVTIDGLGPDVSAQSLREHLLQFGKVEDIEVRERKDKRGIEGAVVRFATIEDAYAAISLQNGCPLPPAIYDFELQGGSEEDLVPAIADGLQIPVEDVVLVSGPDERDGRWVLSASIPNMTIPPESVRALTELEPEREDQPLVTNVIAPPAVNLRLPKRRKKIRPEDQEQLVILDDRLKLEKDKTEALERELRDVLQPQLCAKRDAAEKATSELEAMRQATGWDERKQFSTHTQLDRENQISLLLNELADLQVEQDALKVQNMKKTAMIEALARKLLRRDDVERDCAALEEQLRQKQEDYRDKVENVRSLKRILNKKGKLTDDLLRQDDTADIKKLESDKKVLQHEISRHVDARRSAEKTIQAQHYRLTELENKLKAVASALRSLSDGDKDSARYMPPSWEPGDETVPADKYNDMQQHLAACRQRLLQKDMQILDKDAEVEYLEKKIEIISRAKAANFKRANIDYKMLKSQYELFVDFKEQQRAEAEYKKEELQTETTGLDARYRRISHSMK